MDWFEGSLHSHELVVPRVALWVLDVEQLINGLGQYSYSLECLSGL